MQSGIKLNSGGKEQKREEWMDIGEQRRTV